MINTPSGATPREDEVKIRTTAVYTNTPIMTTLSGAKAGALGIAALRKSGQRCQGLRCIIEIRQVRSRSPGEGQLPPLNHSVERFAYRAAGTAASKAPNEDQHR